MIGFFNRYKSLLLIIGGFIFGVVIGGGFLLYSGKELVNVFVYFTFLVALPAFISIFSFVTFLFSKKEQKQILAFKISSFSGIFFSLGVLFSLILTISTKDIAFGWATTLQIDTSTLKSILDKIAIWRGFCKSCMVDSHLIEISRYNRLGGFINKEQIQNALLLGQWWKFLALSILVYGVLLRAIFYLFSLLFKPKKIEFSSDIEYENFKPKEVKYKNIADIDELKDKNFRLIGYHFDPSKLDLKSSKTAKDVVVVVASWEVPILDFFDFLEELLQSSDRVSILLVGLNGKAKKSDIDIWLRKIKELNLDIKVYR